MHGCHFQGKAQHSLKREGTRQIQLSSYSVVPLISQHTSWCGSYSWRVGGSSARAGWIPICISQSCFGTKYPFQHLTNHSNNYMGMVLPESPCSKPRTLERGVLRSGSHSCSTHVPGFTHMNGHEQEANQRTLWGLPWYLYPFKIYNL